MKKSTEESNTASAETEGQKESISVEVGQLVTESTVEVKPAKKPDFESVTFESFLHPIGW